MMYRHLAAALAALSAVLIASAAWAAALPRSMPATERPANDAGSAAIVQQIHGCHFDMGPGMAPDYRNGPHYHDRTCTVVRAGPSRGYQQRGYDEPPRRPPPRYRSDDSYGYGPGYGPPPHRGPVCTKQCRYTGPIKRCRTVCQ